MIYSHTWASRILEWIITKVSPNTLIDGLWVGSYWAPNDRNEEVLQHLVEALALIRRVDPFRYKRVLRECDRLLAEIVPNGVGEWVWALNRCVVDSRFVLANPPSYTAAVIVRETTLGLLSRYKVAYSRDVSYRHRVKEVCGHQELAFARKVQDGGQVREWVEHQLSAPPLDLSNWAIRDRRRQSHFDAGRVLRIPDWLTSLAIGLGERLRRWQLRRRGF